MLRSGLACASLLLLAPAAAATENLPGVIERVWETQGPPACWLCHTGDIRTRYTITTPFGLSLRAHGMRARDEEALTQALEAVRDDQVDSDHDQTSDYDELRNGTDPNVPEGVDRPERVSYGCSMARGAPAAPWTLTLPALALMWRRRRRDDGDGPSPHALP
jgi:hypothetical protein